jgi:histidine-containing phosphotransfer protein
MGDVDALVRHAVEHGILDDQFVQLQSLQDESNPGFVVDLIHLYHADASKKMQQIEDMLNQAEIGGQQLDACVHQFKGSSASFGAAEMTKICIEFREACHMGDINTCKGITARMREAYGRLQTVLNEFERLETV